MLILVLASCHLWSQAVGVHEAPAPGDLANFAPYEVLPEVAAFACADAELTEIMVRFVRSDGTMDLDAKYVPYATYSFLCPTVADPDLPVGAGGGGTLRTSIIRVGAPGYIHQTSTGSSGPNTKIRVKHRGMIEMSTDLADEEDREDVVPPPTCSPTQLWEQVEGLPSNAVAVISYDDHGYNFSVEDTEIRQAFDFSCKAGRERTAKQKARDAKKELKDKEKEERKK
ncbi:MAG: hypothetical protein HN348_30665 [Proteobacteria bacterium]|jgi:hypothetical protein|nr:hypothetical protein [Pseudomonadota bacterium]